jgi:hypothetical protein
VTGEIEKTRKKESKEEKEKEKIRKRRKKKKKKNPENKLTQGNNGSTGTHWQTANRAELGAITSLGLRTFVFTAADLCTGEGSRKG